MIRKKRSYSRRYCPHCDEEISKSAFYSHRKLYYNPETGSWNSKTNCREEVFNRKDDTDSSSSGMYLAFIWVLLYPTNFHCGVYSLFQSVRLSDVRLSVRKSHFRFLIYLGNDKSDLHDILYITSLYERLNIGHKIIAAQ